MLYKKLKKGPKLRDIKYDPNFGEFDCSTGKDPAINAQNFDALINDISKGYQEMGVKSASLGDLEKTVNDYDLINHKNTSKDKQKFMEEALFLSLMTALPASQLKIILNNKINLDIHGEELYGETPLTLASHFGNLDKINLLLESG